MDRFTDRPHFSDRPYHEPDRYAVDADYDADLGDLAREFAVLSHAHHSE
jgi:hypothetical protein